MTKRRKKNKKKTIDKSRKSLCRLSKRKFSYKKKQMVPSGVKNSTSVANTDLVKSSFGKPEERVSRPLEQDITIREPQPQTYSKVQVDAEVHGENINYEYKRKGKRKISADDPTRDSARSSLKRAITEVTEHRFR